MKDTKLAAYGAKRHFERTPEPAPRTPEPSPGASFVIQEHHARRLHWDLRLELDGVLLSWAVTKEPPTDEGVRRLAVHVEDHPLEYGSFEGQIPAGEYGAGTVRIWDRGVWHPIFDPHEGLRTGKLEFRLEGNRLRGTYVLIRLKGEKDDWLFMRVRDKGDLRDEIPANLTFQLCESRVAPPAGPGWLHELKWDGYRVLVTITQEKVELRSRNGHALSVPALVQELETLSRSAVLDGELVVVDARGHSDFGLIQRAMRGKNDAGVLLIAFDLLYLEGEDLRPLRTAVRRERLRELLARHALTRVRFSEAHEGEPGPVLRQVCEQGLEGLVSKRVDAPYLGKRTSDWIKCRCERTLDAVVGGYTRLRGEDDAIGALILGRLEPNGTLTYIGRVGTGFTDAQRESWFHRLSAHKRSTSPFANKVLPRIGVSFVEPTDHVRVAFLDWTRDGHLRHPRMIAEALPPPKPMSNFRLTHPERVMDPQSGDTKGQVAEYVLAVADLLLAELSRRPLALVRCPDGASEKCFFQKHELPGLGEAVRRIAIGEEGEEERTGLMVEDVDGLMALTQMSVLEWHPWGSRVPEIEKPDRVIFDLDPGPGVDWQEVVRAANLVRRRLAELQLESFVKLTGGKGVHVITPFQTELEWPEVKTFCEHFVKILAKQEPQRFTATLSKKVREGRIFMDYLRNGRGATAVAAYSLRARPGLPVAMPVEWEALPDLEPNQFHREAALRHLADRKSDPWKWMRRAAEQSLRKALQA